MYMLGLGLKKFSYNHIKKISYLIGVAEELTGEHYRLGTEEARRIPYEFRTLKCLEQKEILSIGDVFADIVRYEYEEARFGRKKDLYRINIHDHNILTSLKREAGKVQFSPLLLYILTHELIHIVRFVKFMAPFHLEESNRGEEERIVHRITQGILSKYPLKGLPEVLEKYRPSAQEQAFSLPSQYLDF